MKDYVSYWGVGNKRMGPSTWHEDLPPGERETLVPQLLHQASGRSLPEVVGGCRNND